MYPAILLRGADTAKAFRSLPGFRWRIIGGMLIHPKFPLIGAFGGLAVGTMIWACYGFADGKESIPAIAAMIGFVCGNIAGLRDRFGSKRPPDAP